MEDLVFQDVFIFRDDHIAYYITFGTNGKTSDYFTVWGSFETFFGSSLVYPSVDDRGPMRYRLR